LDFWRGGYYVRDYGNVASRFTAAWGLWWTNRAITDRNAQYLSTDIQPNGAVNVWVPGGNYRGYGENIRCATELKTFASTEGAWIMDIAIATNIRTKINCHTTTSGLTSPKIAEASTSNNSATVTGIIPTPPKIQRSKIAMI